MRLATIAAARLQVRERAADSAFVVTPTGEMTIYVAGGGGRSVATAAESVGRQIATKGGFTPTVEDIAPTSAADPSGTVEFYAVIFISIGASLGATAFGYIMGKVRKPATFLMRTLSLTGYSALLAGVVTVYVDAMLGALAGHTWAVFGALWIYAMAVGGAVTGVAAAFGSAASMLLTLFLVVVGNAAAAGPVGRPLLSPFYSTFTMIVPQGSGVALLRSISYFGGHGAGTPLLTLAIWGAAGCLLAALATASRVNYRAVHERFARRRRPVLRPGPYHRQVDTPSPQAQIWTDRGLVWAYAFNHDEAIRCFERALELDPDLAIARWGIAYAIGPNYNKAWEAFDPADLAASLARARTELGLARDGAGIRARTRPDRGAAARFPTDDPDDTDALLAGHARYADAMTRLANAYPGDIDVQALAADAMVNVTAWALWDTRTGEPAPGSRVLQAKRILDAALATPEGREHPGVLHLYLHAMEMSASPQDALPAADLLRGLVPDAGHLQHMASHIDVLCGDYRNSVVSNHDCRTG